MNRNTRIAIYAVIAVLALYGTWSQNLAYGPALDGFLRDARANPAARSVTIDIFMMALGASFLMVYEARRLAIRFVWAYVFFGLTVAISFTFPLFLIAREFALEHEPPSPRGLSWYDYLALGLTTAFIAWLYWYTLFSQASAA
jgi:hypothetical protein